MIRHIFILIFFTMTLWAKLPVVVSILPMQKLVEYIGAEHVSVTVMVQAGDSPHTYEPAPSQMKDIAKASLYFSIGVEFEKLWLPTFQNLNKKMQVISLLEGITLLPMQGKHHNCTGNHNHKVNLDPHVWTAPYNMSLIVKNIHQALVKEDPKNKKSYTKNAKALIKILRKTDNKLKKILHLNIKNREFIVTHPSWGYFAHAYRLKQSAIEIEGKQPKTKELIQLIQQAKQKNIQTIFTSPHTSDKMASIVAKSLGAKIVKVSPLSPDWSETLLSIARHIASQK